MTMGVGENTKGTKPEEEGPSTPSPEGETPEGASKVSPEATPKVYNEETEKAAIHEAMSAAGRVSTDTAEAERILKAAQKAATDQEAEAERWQNARDEAEREAVKDDAEALKSAEERIRQRSVDAKQAKVQREQDRRGKDLDEREKQVKIEERTRIAAEVAVANDVDIDQILKLAKDDTRKAMEDIAKHLPKKGTKPLLKVDPSKTAGAGEKTEEQRLKARYPTMHTK